MRAPASTRTPRHRALPCLRALLALALLLAPLLVVTAPPAAALHTPEREVTVLVREAEPDDPAPQTRVDNATLLGPAASTGSAFTRMQSALTSRARTGTPFTVELEANVAANGTMEASATWRPTGLAMPDTLDFRFIVIRDDGHDRRFRVLSEPAAVVEPADADGVVRARMQADVPPGERVGVVALVQSASADDGRHQRGETLQSAAWLATQHSATVQADKAVLFEHWTRAEDCPTCPDVDAALLLLASQRGFPADADAFSAGTYLVTPGWRALVGAALGLALGVALVLGRRRA